MEDRTKMNPALEASATARNERADPLAVLARRIETREATVGVIGLGYVGLPLGCTIVEAGLHVAGFDVDGDKIRKLANGESYIRHVPSERIRAALSDTRSVKGFAGNGAAPGFVPTEDFSELVHCDAVVICVPTPLTEGREPDLSYVAGTTATVARYLRPGQLVVLESTTRQPSCRACGC
jgi:UDP-N-acetyl-D-glucosamine dehydrogenase